MKQRTKKHQSSVDEARRAISKRRNVLTINTIPKKVQDALIRMGMIQYNNIEGEEKKIEYRIVFERLEKGEAIDDE